MGISFRERHIKKHESSSNSNWLSHRRAVNRAAQHRCRQRQREAIEDMQHRLDVAEAECTLLLLQRGAEQQVCQEWLKPLMHAPATVCVISRKRRHPLVLWMSSQL